MSNWKKRCRLSDWTWQYCMSTTVRNICNIDKLTAKSAQVIAERLPNLTTLDISTHRIDSDNNNLSAASKERLRSQLPKCNIYL